MLTAQFEAGPLGSAGVAQGHSMITDGTHVYIESYIGALVRKAGYKAGTGASAVIRHDKNATTQCTVLGFLLSESTATA